MALWNRDYMRERDPGLSGRWAVMAITHKLIVVNVVVFLLWQLRQLAPFMADHFTVSWEGVFEHGRVWTLVTSGFSHQGMWHLVWNMLYLHWFGTDLEQIYGRRNFLLLYVYGALVCSLAHVTWSHGWSYDTPALGASGAVMAIVVVTAMFFPQRTILFMMFLPVPLWLLATFKLVGDLAGLIGPADGVAHAGHLGGALGGLAFKLFDLRLFAPPGREETDDARWPGLRAWFAGLRRPVRVAVPAADGPRVDGDTAVQVDELLRKISAEGMGSLSADELAFLKVASERYKRP